MMDIKDLCLDTWINDTSDPTDLKTIKNICFVPLIIWITTYWIQGNNRILTITRITRITCVPFTSCFDQFWLYFPKSNVNGIPAQALWHRCFPVKFVNFLRTPSSQNTSGRLLLFLKE